MVREKIDHLYKERWGHWHYIPIEFRAVLVWAFLNSGPSSKRDYAILFSAIEDMSYNKLNILLESEIEWMSDAIKKLCPKISNECVCEGISLFFNKKVGDFTKVKERFYKEKFVNRTSEMLKTININSIKTRWSWSWIEYWYLNNKTEPFQEQDLYEKWPVAPPGFTEWLHQELEMISKQNANHPLSGTKLGTEGQGTTTKSPLLHGGRTFPLDMAGQEVEKSIREVVVDGRSVMVWGYRLLEFEPDVPYIPFATHFSPRDSDNHKRKLQSVLWHESDWIIGGEASGLVDLPAELRDAVRALKRRNRERSPLSHIVID